MKITVDQKELKQKLQLLNPIVPSRPSHPILSCILFSIEGDTLVLSVFDLSTHLTLNMPCTVTDNDVEKFSLPASLFTDIIDKFQEGDVEISLLNADSNEFELKQSKKRKFKLLGFPSTEFPELPPLTENSTSVELEVTILKNALKHTLMSVSTEESKQVLTGVHVTLKEGNIEFASTDGHRLSLYKDITSCVDNDLEITIPAIPLKNSLLKVLKELASEEEVLTFQYDHSQCQFKFGDMFTLGVRTLDGAFPAYSQLIPTSFKNQLSINKDELKHAISLASVLEKKESVIRFEMQEENLVIHSHKKELGEGEEQVEYNYKGELTNFALKSFYFQDGLNVIEDDEVTLYFNQATTPFIIQSSTDTDFTYLLMPIQLRD